MTDEAAAETRPFCDGAHKACLPTDPSQAVM